MSDVKGITVQDTRRKPRVRRTSSVTLIPKPDPDTDPQP